MEDDTTSTWKSLAKNKIIPFVYKHFLLIGILLTLLLGFTAPEAGAWLGSFKGSSYICVICIFLHSGLKLKTAEVKSVIKEYRAFTWGLLSITILSSILGSKLSQLLPFEETGFNENIHGNISVTTSIVGPREFLLGLELYYISPCAVSSGIVLTSLAGGDVTLALLLTVTTNTLGVLAVPLLARWLVSVKNVQVNMTNLLVKLVSTVLVPLLIGKALTYIPKVKLFVKNHSKVLKIISLIFFICIPWMKISSAQLKGSFSAVSIVSLAIMFAWGLALHLLFLMMNFFSSWVFCFELDVRKTLVILASTKTLAITLSVISFLPDEFGNPGLMSLPLIIIHLSLILIDSFWVVHWNTKQAEEHDSNNEKENDCGYILGKDECTDRIIHNHVTSV